MPVTRACYVPRETVMRAADIHFTARNTDAVDRAIEASSQRIDDETHRRFYCAIETNVRDWPNFDRSYPWRVYLNDHELADITTTVPVVTTGTITIPAGEIFWGPWESGTVPPYKQLQLDRAGNAAFGNSQTPQRDITVTGLRGYWDKRAPAGTLAAAITDTTSTAVTVSGAAVPGTGDVMIVDSERMLVTGRTYVDTGQAQQGTGCSTASAADTALTVTDGTAYTAGEVLLLDSERMLVVDIAANVLTVRRGWDGSVLAIHTGAAIWAARQLTVTRGDFGSTPATHLINAAAAVQVIPGPVRDLALALAQVQALQETGGYSDPEGAGAAAVKGIGAGLPGLWDAVLTGYRRNRTRVV